MDCIGESQSKWCLFFFLAETKERNAWNAQIRTRIFFRFSNFLCILAMQGEVRRFSCFIFFSLWGLCDV